VFKSDHFRRLQNLEPDSPKGEVTPFGGAARCRAK
jgi:hypothetical protein